MRKKLWQVTHILIILNFVAEIAYSSAMTFLVVRPAGHAGPLWSAAMTIPFEMMVTRRLYAIEFWIAIAGLSVYLAVTEILPSRLKNM